MEMPGIMHILLTELNGNCDCGVAFTKIVLYQNAL